MALINGTPGDDILNGTPGDDTILGEAGNDILRGKDGDDRLEGGDGKDKLFGGAGSDRLFGGDGNDLLNPGDNTGDDIINAGKGKDKIVLSQALTGYVGIDQWDLDARITVNIDGNANTAKIIKAGAGTTTIIDIINPMLNGGLGVNGTAFNDVFNITVADGGWMQFNGGKGADSYDIGASTGSVRLDFRDFDVGATGVEVNLATGVIADDGYGNAETISGTGKVWEVRGSMQDDTITGSGNDESFILMAGNDVLDGGAGYDRLRYDRTGVDGVTVDLGTGTANGMWRGEAFVHTISGIERVVGSVGDDILRGGLGDDRLEGRDGNDTLRGGDGNDRLEGGDGNDILRGEAGDDRLEGGNGKDKLFGGAGSDRLFGGDGNDLLNPGDNTSYDVINAGRGKDKIVLSEVLNGSVGLDHWDLSAGITANIDGNANTGKIKKVGAGTSTIIDIENPMLADGVTISGTAFDDVFNVTVANGGWMAVHGRAGKDSYNIGASTGSVRLDLRDSDGVATGVEVNLATGTIADDGFGNGEVITGPGKISEIRSTMRNDTITGSANDESFILMAGNDVLDGGAGYDKLRYDRTGVDGVTVNLGTGTASGMWRGEAFVHTISNIEQVVGSGGNDILRGSAGDDRLEGGNGNDKLFGGAGTDRLRGGDGNDILNPGDNTSFDAINAGRGNDKIVLSGISTGYAQLDHWDLSAGITANIDGNANTGTISKSGGAGTTTVTNIKNPMLANGLGIGGTSLDDTFNVTVVDGGWMQVRGDAGKDSYNIATSTGQVRLDFRDTQGVTTGVTVNLTTGKVKDDGFGNGEVITGPGKIWEVRATMQDDKITGSGNDESFILMAGTDIVNGKGGFDRLRYDQTGVDGVTVDLGSGTASGTWGGKAFIHTITNIEHLRGSNGDDSLTGSAGNDRLEGFDGDDVIKGAGGKDTLLGGTGKDKLLGGKGNDRMDGGAGNDRMTGGKGNDTFVFGTGADVVTDFNAANNKEKIDLSGVGTFTNFNNLKNNFLTEVAGNVVIDDGADNTMTLNGLGIGDLDAGDFIF